MKSLKIIHLEFVTSNPKISRNFVRRSVVGLHAVPTSPQAPPSTLRMVASAHRRSTWSLASSARWSMDGGSTDGRRRRSLTMRGHGHRDSSRRTRRRAVGAPQARTSFDRPNRRVTRWMLDGHDARNTCFALSRRRMPKVAIGNCKAVSMSGRLNAATTAALTGGERTTPPVVARTPRFVIIRPGKERDSRPVS